MIEKNWLLGKFFCPLDLLLPVLNKNKSTGQFANNQVINDLVSKWHLGGCM